jgi:hypothetical protein
MSPTTARDESLLFLLMLLSLLAVAGCSFQQESDWRWKQWNPNYRPPYPEEEGLYH